MESSDGERRKEGVSKGQTAHFMILNDSSKYRINPLIDPQSSKVTATRPDDILLLRGLKTY
jgi:hypothetical protein